MNGSLHLAFLELVEDHFGYQMVDKLIMETKLQSNGIYTSASEYDDSELQSLMEQLKKYTSFSNNELIALLGERLFSNFKTKYNSTLLELESATANLILIENFITTIVRKLYNKFNQPAIEIAHYSKTKLILNCTIDSTYIPLINGFLIAAIKMSDQSITLEIIQSEKYPLVLQSITLEQTA